MFVLLSYDMIRAACIEWQTRPKNFSSGGPVSETAMYCRS